MQAGLREHAHGSAADAVRVTVALDLSGAEGIGPGAVSELFEAGAETADVMRTAAHTQMSTTTLDNRGAIVHPVAWPSFAKSDSRARIGTKTGSR